MNILLLQPPTLPASIPFPPLGLGYVGTFLKEHNYEVEICDLNFLTFSKYRRLKHPKHNWDEIGDFLKQKELSVVGISCSHTSYTNNVYRLAKIVKNINNDSSVFVGGFHATALPKQTLKECGYIDSVVIGGGEYTSLDLIDNLTSGENIGNIPGICIRHNGKIIRTEDRKPVNDIDEFKLDRELMKIKDYQKIWKETGTQMYGFSDPAGYMITSRGCVGRCTYCAQRLISKRIQFRTIENVVQEIEDIKTMYKCSKIYFMDGTFNASKKRVIAFCEKIKSMDIEWFCFARVSNLEKELLTRMKQAGCVGISLGLESGDQRVLDFYKKGVSLSQYYSVVKAIKSVGIYVHGSFIIGAPIETKEMIFKSLDLAKKLKLDAYGFNLLTPYPGTELWDILERQGLLKTSTWDNYYHGTRTKSVELYKHPRFSKNDLNILIKHCGCLAYCDSNLKSYEKNEPLEIKIYRNIDRIRSILGKYYFSIRSSFIKERG